MAMYLCIDTTLFKGFLPDPFFSYFKLPARIALPDYAISMAITRNEVTDERKFRVIIDLSSQRYDEIWTTK